jgi:hypothetical protein
MHDLLGTTLCVPHKPPSSRPGSVETPLNTQHGSVDALKHSTGPIP